MKFYKKSLQETPQQILNKYSNHIFEKPYSKLNDNELKILYLYLKRHTKKFI